jgi:hypothetical protein
MNKREIITALVANVNREQLLALEKECMCHNYTSDPKDQLSVTEYIVDYYCEVADEIIKRTLNQV